MATILPILRLRSTLISSIHRHLEDDELLRFQDELLNMVRRIEAAHVILDLGGLDVVDTFMSRQLALLATSCRLMGARVLIAGLQPEVAVTMVEMRHSIPGVECALDLDHAVGLLEKAPASHSPSDTPA